MRPLTRDAAVQVLASPGLMAVPDRPLYEYRALGFDEIRLIALAPWSGDEADDVIDCSIESHKLVSTTPWSDSPSNHHYEAVSYVWGNGQLTRSILSREGRIEITQHVYDILRCLQRRAGPTYSRFWVDAICINQKDDHERSIQVQRMRQIYEEAVLVHIILGTNLTLRECDKSEWFTRRWVVQEALSAPSIRIHLSLQSDLCFNSWTELEAATQDRQAQSHLRKLFACYDTKKHRLDVPSLFTHRNPRSDLGILELLWTFRDRNCSDPRDRIIALASIASDICTSNHFVDIPQRPCGLVHLLPDYTRSTASMFKEFAQKMMRSSKHHRAMLWMTLQFRQSSLVSIENTDSLPTWVPDWSIATPYVDDTLDRQLVRAVDARPWTCPRFRGRYAIYTGIFIGDHVAHDAGSNSVGALMYLKLEAGAWKMYLTDASSQFGQERAIVLPQILRLEVGPKRRGLETRDRVVWFEGMTILAHVREVPHEQALGTCDEMSYYTAYELIGTAALDLADYDDRVHQIQRIESTAIEGLEEVLLL